ncbi:DHH family phosphoesterase, partial [Candidatus Dojkabacteria bacterium]|nr:DHH family phosphoesterase [Candidatus Dojkabacteria bacterium]
ILILLDANQFKRVGRFNKHKMRSVCIDHHDSTPDEFDLYLSDTDKSSSTVEIIYKLWKEEFELTKKTAKNIMCGILDDTGGLLYVKPSQTLVTAGEMMAVGVNLQDLKTRLFAIGSKPYELFKFMVETSKLENGFVSFLVTESDLAGYSKENLAHAKEMITKNVYYYLSDADWGAIIYPIETGSAKARLLSRGKVDVNKVASKFGGGGHKQSSGCKMKGTPEMLLAEFRKMNENMDDYKL